MITRQNCRRSEEDMSEIAMSSKVAIQKEVSPTSTSSSPISSSVLQPEKVRRSRASKPKVKTGCQTCKIRRVKCDEAKPSCMRCLRFGHQCDGYPNLPSGRKYPASTINRRILVPKQSPPLEKFSQVLLPIPIAGPQEQQHFQSFCSRTIPTEADPDQWRNILKRACQEEPTIRDTVLAVEQLDPNSREVHGAGSEIGTLKHFASFRLFGKSSFYMQRGRHEVRSTPFATLLYHFGGLELEASEKGICSGLRMLREWCSRNYVLGSGEDDVFDEIELEVLRDADVWNSRRHWLLRERGQDAVDQMPSQFTDVAEARDMLELIIERSMHWLASTMHMVDFSNSPRDRRRGKMFMNMDEKLEEQIITVGEYRRWEAAVRPLLEESRTMRLIMREEYRELLMLRMLWLAGYLGCCSHLMSGSFKHVRFRAEVAELVDIANSLLVHPPSSTSTPTSDNGDIKEADWGSRHSSSKFDVKSLIPLMSVGWAYKNRSIRKMAIALLLAGPSRNGGYEGVLLGKMMAWLNGLEEEDLAGDVTFVPQERAARTIKFCVDAEARSADLKCLLPINGDMIRKEAVISW